MIVGLAQARGAPCPTVVLDLTALPEDRASLVASLAAIRRHLASVGLGDVLKVALAAPARDADVDLDYRFVQALPGDFAGFDFAGSCGHSILAVVAVAARAGWIPPLDDRTPVRIRLLNDGGRVLCTGCAAGPRRWRFQSVEFVNHPPVPLSDLLLTGRPRDTVRYAGARYQVSLVSMGNPYVFVSATALGLPDRTALFGAGETVQRRMLGIRRAAAKLVGRPPESTFPKVAAVGASAEGRLFIRAVSVPTWHPTLALTGASCLAAAVAIPGTIPNGLAPRGGGNVSRFDVDTPAGPTSIASAVSHHRADGELTSVSIGGKEVRLLSPPAITDLAHFATLRA
jgi:2-methylaconitate cis-trans-isomerase PrpF